jgi:phosphatidylglycerol lysyltransferase
MSITMIPKPQLERISVIAVTSTALASGLAAVFTPLIDRLPVRLSGLADTFHPLLIHRALSTFLGFALIYISYQLVQRRLAAWWTALIISVYFVLSGLLPSVSHAAAALAAINVLFLVIARNQFTARTEYRSIRQGFSLLVFSLLFAIIYGIIGFWLLDSRDFGRNFSLEQAAGQTLQEYSLSGDGSLVPHTRYARGFLDSLDFMGVLGVGFGLYSLFRPLSYSLRILPHERELMAGLLERYGDYSEGGLKLWPGDKSYFFTAQHAAGIAYRVNAGVALVAGAPVGSLPSRQRAIESFTRYCRNNSWDPTFVLVPESALELFGQGWRRLKIGEDALVPLEHFKETVAGNKHFRNIRNRFTKAGYRFEVHQPPHAAALVRELRAVNTAWLASGKRQWGFLQGGFDPAYLATGPLYVVRNESGRVMAFANGIQTYVPGQTSIDMMRHQPDAPSNTMDFLLMELLLAAAAEGYRQFSLGIAPLANTVPNPESGPEDRIIQAVMRLNQDFLSIDGLRQFKNKFEPEWESQYILYRGLPPTLAKVGLGLARATRV